MINQNNNSSDLMNNSNQPTQMESKFNFLNDWNIMTSNETIGRGKIPFKNRVISSINKEIDLIKERENLTLRRIGKKVKGKTIEVNENRFWKPSIENPNNLLVSVKVKGKIVKFTNDTKQPYLIIENDKDKLVSLLNNIKSNVKSISEEHPIWKLNEETNTKKK